MRLILLFTLCFLNLFSFAQPKKIRPLRILFIGNSYTFVNDLPQICVGVAASAGDVISFDSYAPGGYSLQQHASDSNTVNKIKQGDWDHVVLQEQSRRPSFPINEVERDVFPYAHSLDSMIHLYNPSAKTMFYLTWGKENGDSVKCKTWAEVCTYKGMDNLLALRYGLMAEINKADISPVGAVWRSIRENYPSIKLYQSDESHPTEAGSYAAAVCFYTVLFKKDPGVIKYNYTLSNSDALKIRVAVKKIVFDNLSKWEFKRKNVEKVSLKALNQKAG